MWMICPVCKLKIGGLDHILIKKERHFRLFLNKKQKSYNFDYKLLSEFKEIVNKKKEFKGKLILNFLKSKIIL